MIDRDQIALDAATKIMDLVYGPTPLGGSAQLKAGVQVTVTEAMAAERARGIELNADTIDILGRPNFACAGIARALRMRGDSILHRAENEQAAAIRFLLGHYFSAGARWRVSATEELEAIWRTAPQPAAGPNLTGAAPDGATEASVSVHAAGER